MNWVCGIVARAAGGGDLARVGGLMVVGGAGQRHQDRGAAGGGQLGNRRGTGAGDDQMRPAELLGQVGQIGGEIGRNLVPGIAGARRVDILDPCLMRHLQPAAEGDGEHREAVGHDLRQHARPLRPAGDEDAEDTVLLQQRIGFRPQRQHRLAHRIADRMDLRVQPRRQPLGLVIARRDRIDAARDQPVDAAQHRVLLVQRGRDALRERGEQRRQRGIAAEADHGGGLEGSVQLARHRAARPHLSRGRQPAQRALHLEAPGGEDVRLDAFEQPRKLHPARVADQRDTMPAPGQLGRQRGGGDHVATGAAGGEDVMLRAAHPWPHFTT